MHSQRFIIDATSVVVTQARIGVGFRGRSGWSRGLPDEQVRREMPRFNRAVPRAAVSENRLSSENRRVRTRFSCGSVGHWPMFVYVIYALERPALRLKPRSTVFE